MSESRWPLVLLLIGVILFAVAAILGLLWIVNASHLPMWLKTLLNIFLTGFFISGGSATRKRIPKGKSPWSLKKPERG